MDRYLNDKFSSFYMAVAETLDDITAQKKRANTLRLITVIIALAVIAAGVLPLLNQYGIIGFELQLPAIAINSLLIVAGLFLLLNAMRS
jgi:hypothetical protein